MPFLEILTRTFNQRPIMLGINQASLEEQTDDDWIQTLLVDEERRGIGWSHENMARYAPKLVGDYIWCLDDDDMCICETLVSDLKAIVAEHDPDVVMVRMNHGGAIIPGYNWGSRPIYGQVDVTTPIVRRRLWQANAHAMIPGWYGSDYSLINAIWMDKPIVYWHDEIVSKRQRQSFGKAENEEIENDSQEISDQD